MKKMINRIFFGKTKYLMCYLIIALSILVNADILYAKRVDLSGLSINLTLEKQSELSNKGSNVDNENKEVDKDKSVVARLTITNNNPYERAKITIKENAPQGFRQNGLNKNTSEKNINIKKNENETLTYNYKYDKKFLVDQYNSIVYDEDGNIIDDNDTQILIENRENYINADETNKNYKEFSIDKEKQEEIDKKYNKRSSIFLIILIVVFGAVILYFVFISVLTRIRDMSNEHYDDPFKMLIFLLLSSFIISFVCSSVNASSYIPNIYSKKDEFKKVIFESIQFNERYYRFEYEIVVKFSNNNSIAYTENDTDGDLLSDYDEYMYMTDMNNKDTDNDGLSDYIEVKLLNYNPLSYDTFNDSRNDANRDYDGDGLSNIKEVELGTSLILGDTDGDLISDYDEVYGEPPTNPLYIDTDGDGLNDYAELKLGLDPTNMYTDGITLDSERKIEQSLDWTIIPNELRTGDVIIKSVSGSVNGLIDENITFHNYQNNNFDNVMALVSNPFRVENEDNNKVKVTFDVSRVYDRIEKLILCKYENGMFIPVDTDFKGNEILADVTSGIYGVLDSEYILRDMRIYISDYLN